MKDLSKLVAKGATLTVVYPEGSSVDFGIVNEFKIILEQDSKTWVMWNTLGYEEEARYTHTMRVLSIDKKADGAIVVEDCYHRVYILTPITGNFDKFKYAIWISKRASKKDAFDRLDTKLEEMSLNIAKNWKKD